MIPYALYPLTNKRAVSHHTGFDGNFSIATYKTVLLVEAVANWFARRYSR